MNEQQSYKRSDGQTIKLIGRNSRLSLLQIDIVKQKIQSAFPGLKVDVIARSSRGDVLQEIPLHTVGGTDFFTQDIFDSLQNGVADIAVHSLKDMSSGHFFGSHVFAVVDRDDARDVAIVNEYSKIKIQKGGKLIIGTCSPRREEMAIGFLKNALPRSGKEITIETKNIRGNVDTRLRKLDNGEYDGIILAAAGLNRLLRSKEDAASIRELLKDKWLLLLPLIECVPAPCQGAIVAEADPSNTLAVDILKKINDEDLFTDCYKEKQEALKYGAGCIQKFGVTTINTKNGKYLYAAGKDAEGTAFVKWDPLPDVPVNGKVFSSTDEMKSFYKYEESHEKNIIEKPCVFVSNYKAVQAGSGINMDKRIVLASGTKTWFELAKQGIWVTGSADGLGFEFLLPSLAMPLFDIEAADILILTHESAAVRWRNKGYNAMSNHKLVSGENVELKQTIAVADLIFWTSYSQFEFYGKYAKPGVRHICAGGETATLLKQQGLQPVIFPTIKAFEQWRKSFTRPHSVA